MPLQNLSHEVLQQFLTEIDLALNNYHNWCGELIRTIACRLPPDKRDIIPNAHKECRFGQWYYGSALSDIRDNPSISAIGEVHHRMHQLVAQVLINTKNTGTISPFDFDKVSNIIEQFRLEILTFKNELETLLFNRDTLTMTINRVNMLPFLRDQQEVIKRQHRPDCIAIIDVDFFKEVNDKHGHPAGDKVLVALAQYLMEHLRSYDKVFRYGGEEFLVFMQEVDSSQSYQMVERVREGIAATPFDVGLPEPIHVTVSCGVTVIDANSTIEELIDRADKALYLAKTSGRNQTQLWNAGIEQKTIR